MVWLAKAKCFAVMDFKPATCSFIEVIEKRTKMSRQKTGYINKIIRQCLLVQILHEEPIIVFQLIQFKHKIIRSILYLHSSSTKNELAGPGVEQF
jgi:hypothetical protein